MKKLLVIAWFGLFYCSNIIAQTETSYIINIAESVQTNERQIATENYLTKLYAPLNITPTFLYLPSQRGLKLVNEGKLDAEGGRTKVIAQRYSNLYLIPEPIMQFKSGIFCRRENNCLPSKNLVISYLSGFQAAKLHCNTQDLTCAEVDSSENLAKAFNEKLTDAMLSGEREAPQVLCQTEQRTFYYRNLTALDFDIFHLVHVKHHAHIPALIKSVKSLGQLNMVKTEDWRANGLNCNKTIIELPSL